MGRYDQTCWNCKRLQEGDANMNGGREAIWCNHYNWVGVNDLDGKPCSYYEPAYRSDRTIEQWKADLYKKAHYYVLSTCCYILGISFDCEYMKAFEEAVNHLENTSDGRILMDEYDFYGQLVAYNLYSNWENATTKKETLEFIESVIMPQIGKMTRDVYKGNLRSAILKYIALVRRLMQKYDIAYDSSNKTIYDSCTKLIKSENKSVVCDTLNSVRSLYRK